MELERDELRRLERLLETQGRDDGEPPMNRGDLGWALAFGLGAWVLVLVLVHALGWLSDVLGGA